MGDATSPLDDAALLTAFEQCTIPPAQWNHRAHIRVAFLYAREHDFEAALIRMRAGLRGLNAAHRTPETGTRGYHETITVAFLSLIYARCRAERYPSSQTFCDLNPELMSKDALLHYYSRERLFSSAAKARFLEPDLAPLPD